MATAEVILAEQAKETATKLEIVVNRKELISELAAAVGVVETRTTIPILTNLLLDASGLSDSVRIAATNLSQSLKTSLSAKIKEPGVAAIPARKLYEYVCLLDGDDLTIKQEENNWVQIRCGRSRTRMVGMDAETFPQIPSPESWADEFDAAFILQMIEQVLISVATNNSRYALNAALMVVSPKSVEMVSSDGHRLTRIRKPLHSDHPKREVLIPLNALKELVKLLKGEDGSVHISEDASSLFFQVGRRVFASQKLTLQFPNYEAALSTASGEMPNGFPAEALKYPEQLSGGQLNPAHSRWLQGLPPVFCDCAVMAMESRRKSHKRS